jgi:hypothetical protein
LYTLNNKLKHSTYVPNISVLCIVKQALLFDKVVEAVFLSCIFAEWS